MRSHGVLAPRRVLRGEGVQDLQVLSIRFFRPAFVHVAEKKVPVPGDVIVQPPVDLEQALIPERLEYEDVDVFACVKVSV